MDENENAAEIELGDLRPFPEEWQLVSVLSGVYLEAGLPLEVAVRSAIADYECSFQGAELCLR